MAEQIKALNDLSEIVARHSNPVDVALPDQRRAATSTPAAPGRPAPAPKPAAPAQPARAAAPAPARPERERPTWRSEQPAPAEPQAPARTAGRKDDRWSLSDVLAIASNAGEEEPRTQGPRRPPTPVAEQRSPAQMLESLDAIAVDIVRAIDDNAFMDLYDRYRRGERDIFIRRLYAQRDRGVIDEVRRKYRRDPELRDAVNRYVAGFEELATLVSKTDRDGVLRQMYLTSEPSKVYALLSEASGRTT
ncbi:hypothetical protein N177_0473 [Lutibaculum baratangense AMV1]|uniref:Uncharacterized protein n=1 Tax=Lutibaculum baratangense AMV1 TaxID=631454 RepID=V4RN17_9HYPH|nr:hypothetical protein N177_0473 [Lutibaculum baratangense AMV1]